jgi:lysozyme family protein
MADDFDEALKFVLRWEGGFVDDPRDHGGRTMKGITQAVYDSWGEAHGQPSADVKNISDADVDAVYRKNYWAAASCDLMRAHLNLVTFDTAVNMGPVRAVKILQRVLNLDQDGVFGNHTRQACDACHSDDAVKHYCDLREAIYRGLAEAPNQGAFLAGWLNRLNALRAEAGVAGARPVQRGADDGPTKRVPDLAPDAPLDIEV